MILIDDCLAILRPASFLLRRQADDRLFFEDEVIFGVVLVYPDVRELLSRWEKNQDVFLHENASRIRRSGPKSWNIYTVHLTTASASAAEAIALARVEEDFRGTRKIAKAELLTPEALEHALCPILPLTKFASIALSPLAARIETSLNLPPTIKRAVLQGAPADDIAKAFLATEGL